MSHDPHNDNPRQILQDGCAECEQRGEHIHVAIGSLDETRFEQAWKRAASWQRGQLPNSALPVSDSETPLLRALWAMQVQLERRGFPIGQVPTW